MTSWISTISQGKIFLRSQGVWSESRQSRRCFLLMPAKGTWRTFCMYQEGKWLLFTPFNGRGTMRRGILLNCMFLFLFFLSCFRKINGGSIYSPECHHMSCWCLGSVYLFLQMILILPISSILKFFLSLKLFLSNEIKQREILHFLPRSLDLWHSHNKGQIWVVWS